MSIREPINRVAEYKANCVEDFSTSPCVNPPLCVIAFGDDVSVFAKEIQFHPDCTSTVKNVVPATVNEFDSATFIKCVSDGSQLINDPNHLPI